MGTILSMVRKDLLRKLRAPLGILVMLLFPVVFALIIAVTFSGGGVPRARLLVENRDRGFLGNVLLSALGSNEVAEHFDVDVVGEEGMRRIRRGKGSALLRIPEGFTRDMIDGAPTTLELIRNPAEGIMPEVAEQVAGILAEVLSAGSRVLRGPLDTMAPFTRSRDLRMSDAGVAALALTMKGTIERAEKYLDPVVIRLETVDLGTGAAQGSGAAAEGSGGSAAGSGARQSFSIFLLVFPGVSVWALFMIGDIAMRDILTENEAGTLRRQLQGPVDAGTILIAKAIFTFVLSLICLLLLSIAGCVARDRPVNVVGYVLVSLSLILAVTGAGATIYGASGREGRGATIASVLYITLGFAGGSFIELKHLPGAVRAMAPVSPFYWGTQGYRALLDGGGALAVLPSVVVLAGLGLGLMILGSLLLRRRILRGGAA